MKICVGNGHQSQRLCVALVARHVGINLGYQTDVLWLQHRDELNHELFVVMRRLTSADTLQRLELDEVFVDEGVQRRGLQLTIQHE